MSLPASLFNSTQSFPVSFTLCGERVDHPPKYVNILRYPNNLAYNIFSKQTPIYGN